MTEAVKYAGGLAGFGVRMGIALGTPWREGIYLGIPGGRAKAAKVQILTPSEWEHLLATAQRTVLTEYNCPSVRPPHIRLLHELVLRLFVECGLWNNEIALLKTLHFGRAPDGHWQLAVPSAGNARARIIKLPENVGRLLAECDANQSIGGEIRDGDLNAVSSARSIWGGIAVENAVLNLMRASGLRAFRVSFLTLRNTFCDRFISGGGDLDALLRHIGLGSEQREFVQNHLFEIDQAKDIFIEWEGIEARMYASRPSPYGSWQ